MTAIHAQTERKRQDRSVGRAEKHRRRARTRQLRGLIPTVPAARPAAEAAQGENMLVQRLDSDNLHVKRHATWGMSVEIIPGYSITSPQRQVKNILAGADESG
jgi:hypothetical protein